MANEQVRASALRPGDCIMFGDHTGLWYVRRVERRGEKVRVSFWLRKMGWSPLRRKVGSNTMGWWLLPEAKYLYPNVTLWRKTTT